MFDRAQTHVEPALWRIKEKAQFEMVNCYHQQTAAAAICEAIPNPNNVWHEIFNTHRIEYRDKQAYWFSEYRKAEDGINNMIDNLRDASNKGKDVIISVETLNFTV